MVTGYMLPVPAAGSPPSAPVDELNVTPEGSAPDSDTDGAGRPAAVTVNEPAAPTLKLALFALVIAGAISVGLTTVSVKFCFDVLELLNAAIPEVQTPAAIVKAEVVAAVPELN